MKGLSESKARESVWILLCTISNWERQRNRLYRAFPLSTSATSTRRLLITSLTAKRSKSILQQQEAEADALQEKLESNPDYKKEIAELRSRLMNQWADIVEKRKS